MPDIVRNGDLSYKQRVDLIKRCFMICGIDLVDEKPLDNGFYHFDILLDGKQISLYVLSKNIVNSGWSDKPFIKRIQVKPYKLNEVEKNTLDTSSLFIGIAYANEIPICVAWNPFMFLYHNTNRSCYINVELIARCQHEGMIKTKSSGQDVILCEPAHFKELIVTFLNSNATTEI